MSSTLKYNLVHITTGGEYKTPLVASQLFDQAQCQAVNKGIHAPHKTEAWVIGAMREYIDIPSQSTISNLSIRCPDIRIRMINGISRLQSFPVIALMKFYRTLLGTKTPVIYHCRGTDATEWALKLKKHYPQDKVIMDVRGYWPAEKLYENGIEYPELATGTDKELYVSLNNRLKDILLKADALTTVSNALRTLLINELGATQQCAVVPCCVSQITPDDKRNELRKEWGVKDGELLLVYSGTTAAYQHLEDLTIPFMKELSEKDEKIKLAFFSSQIDKIKSMLIAAGIDPDKVILKSFQQTEVAAALTACDAGILIRKPTLVNRVANPVKIAEYLAAGLPIIIEREVGGVADEMFEKKILQGITITQKNAHIPTQASETLKWLGENTTQRRQDVRDYVSKVYLWSAAIHVSRKLYQGALSNRT